MVLPAQKPKARLTGRPKALRAEESVHAIAFFIQYLEDDVRPLNAMCCKFLQMARLSLVESLPGDFAGFEWRADRRMTERSPTVRNRKREREQ